MGKPKPKDKVKCVRAMKEYTCALGDDCCTFYDDVGNNFIQKGEDHLTHAQVAEDGKFFTERYHKDCWPEYSHLARGEEVRI